MLGTVSQAQPGSYPEGFQNTTSCDNAAVYMMNEAMHGLLIIQRIFENDNQTMNQYANLDSRKINFYGNEDLPKNVFADPEHLFYAVTPYDWLNVIDKRCLTGKKGLNTEVQSDLKDIKQLLDDINQMRFTLDEAMRTKDLNKADQLSEVYALMEKSASYCDRLLDLRNKLQAKIPIAINSLNPDQQTFIKMLLPLYKSAEQLIMSVRKDEEPKVKLQLKLLKESLARLTNQDALVKKLTLNLKTEAATRFNQAYANITAKATSIIKEAEEYLLDTPINDQYKAYGRNYYYYNVKLLSLFNRYGKGMASEINQILLYGNFPVPGILELPHYVKIIYPEKRPEVVRSKVETEVVFEVVSEVFWGRLRSISVNTTEIQFSLK